MKLALIDNYDSFTYNLRALLAAHVDQIDVFRNDKLTTKSLEEYDGIVFSPGPGVPEDAGLMMEIIQTYYSTKPMLGICLGMQALGQMFGANLVNMNKALHGISLPVKHFNDPIFEDVPTLFEAARYHSWVLSPNSFPAELKIIGTSENGMIMAIAHHEFPLYGFQFHPESILTRDGDKLLRNFINQIKIYSYENVDREIV